MKICTKCNMEKPETEYYKRSDRDTLFTTCKECHCASSVERVKKYRRDNPERMAVKDRKSHLKYLYGITPEDYDRILLEQKGVCAICGSDDPYDRWTRFHIDHCHSTGKIRGLLCSHCNHILGKANDDPSILLAAIQYLSRNSRPTAV